MPPRHQPLRRFGRMEKTECHDQLGADPRTAANGILEFSAKAGLPPDQGASRRDQLLAPGPAAKEGEPVVRMLVKKPCDTGEVSKIRLRTPVFSPHEVERV